VLKQSHEAALIVKRSAVARTEAVDAQLFDSHQDTSVAGARILMPEDKKILNNIGYT
jgi:hypothetical protein